jgi:hypothetical protein
VPGNNQQQWVCSPTYKAIQGISNAQYLTHDTRNIPVAISERVGRKDFCAMIILLFHIQYIRSSDQKLCKLKNKNEAAVQLYCRSFFIQVPADNFK